MVDHLKTEEAAGKHWEVVGPQGGVEEEQIGLAGHLEIVVVAFPDPSAVVAFHKKEVVVDE